MARTAFAAALGLMSAGAWAQPAPLPASRAEAEDPPINFSADEVNYDQTLGIVTASGKVEVLHQDRMLIADSISYNQRQDMITANGNITLLEPTGEVLFAEHMEISGDLKNGIMENIRVILADRARVAANGARRSDGSITEFAKGVYSPCEPCKGDPSRPPLWQIKAVRVVHDQTRQIVEYKDAWVEFAGVPVVYTPYLTHADPTVKRKSGFLTPTVGMSSYFGAFAETPYFWVIDPHSDLTVRPRLSTDEGALLSAEHRQKLLRGETRTAASLTEDSRDEVRGHIKAKGRFDHDATWRWGYDVDRASDDTYLRRYGFGSGESALTSRLFTEGFRHRNYLSVEGQMYQGLRSTDDPGATPYAVPMVEYSHVGDPGPRGAYTTLDANLLALTRTDGRDTRRASVITGWHLPHTGPMGDVYTLSASLQTDAYHVSEHTWAGHTDEYDGAAGRAVPQLALDWRYPFVKRDGAIHQTIEPMASFVVSPYGGNSDRIPNEDSLEFEYDDINLFSQNRFVGLDRIEGGPRVNYGVKWGAYGAGGGSTSLLLGQSYRYHKDDTFAEGSGLEDNFSDYVGRLNVSPNNFLSFNYRARLDKDDFAARRNEVGTNVGTDTLRLGLSYSFFDGQEGSTYGDREEVRANIGAQWSRFWRSQFNVTHDFAEEDGGLRQIGLGMIYEDECFLFSTTAQRNYYRDRDLEPDNAIIFRFSFKTLGEFQTSAF